MQIVCNMYRSILISKGPSDNQRLKFQISYGRSDPLVLPVLIFFIFLIFCFMQLSKCLGSISQEENKFLFTIWRDKEEGSGYYLVM